MNDMRHVVSGERLAQIAAEFDRATQAKLDLADLEISYTLAKSALFDRVHNAQRQYKWLIENAASALGITTAGGKWKFNVSTGEFTLESQHADSK